MIEFNTEAKKVNLWTHLKSLEEFKKAREEGKQIAWWFGLADDDYETFSPVQGFTDQYMKTRLEKCKVCVHQTNRVVVEQGVTWANPIFQDKRYFKVMCFRNQYVMNVWFDNNPLYQKLGPTRWQIIEDPQIAFG